MHEDEIIIKIVGRISGLYPEIDIFQLRGVIEKELYGYEINQKVTAIAILGDFDEKLKLYLATKKLDGLSMVTLKNYALHLKRFGDYFMKDIKDITTMDIRAYLADWSTKNKVQNSTLETEKSIIRSFFDWLEIEDYLVKSPARKIKPTKVEIRTKKSLNVEELELMRDACKTDRQRALLEFFFSSGCRLSEVYQINRSSINWNDLCVSIIGKGNKERLIYFSPKAKIYLLKYFLSRKTNPENDNPLFLGMKDPWKRLGKRAIEVEIKNIAKQAGFTESIHPHTLRRTYATLARNAGMPLDTIKTLMGHSDISTTMGYITTDPESISHEYRKRIIQ